MQSPLPLTQAIGCSVACVVVDIYNERLKASRHQQVADEDGVIEEAVPSIPIGRRVMAWMCGYSKHSGRDGRPALPRHRQCQNALGKKDDKRLTAEAHTAASHCNILTKSGKIGVRASVACHASRRSTGSSTHALRRVKKYGTRPLRSSVSSDRNEVSGAGSAWKRACTVSKRSSFSCVKTRPKMSSSALPMARLSAVP